MKYCIGSNNAGAINVHQYESVAMKSVLPGFVLLLLSGAVLADDGSMLRCRTLSDGVARLACYDAVPLALPGSPAAVAAATTMPAAAPTRQMQEQSFGLEQKIINQNRLEEIESYIPGKFEGWGPRQTITLANGQRWRVVDDSEAFMNAQDPKVVVTRGAIGAIYMDIDGSNKRPKVVRVN